MNRHSLLVALVVASSCRCGDQPAKGASDVIVRPPHEARAPEADAEIADPLPPGAIARIGSHRLHHGATVTALALSSDERLLASAGVDETVALWSLKTGRLLHRFSKAREPLAFDPKGETLATAGTTARLHLFDTTSGAELNQRIESNRPDSLAFASDARELVVSSGHDEKRFDLATQQVASEAPRKQAALERRREAKLTVPGLTITALSNGAIVVARGDDPEGHTTRRMPVLRVAAGGDDTLTLSSVHSLETWTIPDATLADADVLGDAKAYLAAVGDDRIYIGEDGHVASRTLEGERRELTPEGCEAQEIALSRNSRRIAIACADRSVRIIEVSSAKQLASFESPPGAVRALDFSPDAKLVAASAGDKIRIHSLLPKPSLKRELTNPEGSVAALSFSPDGKQLASVDDAGSLRVWTLATGAERDRRAAHGTPATAVAWSADGKFLATGARDGAVHAYDQKAGTDQGVFVGHLGEVTSLAFTRARRPFLLSGSVDGTVVVWPMGRGGDE